MVIHVAMDSSVVKTSLVRLQTWPNIRKILFREKFARRYPCSEAEVANHVRFEY
uniref:Uncharacterized protein n=1 Tax=Nelumbo nucifera TaxID=4432 RepID=A0A822XKM0_NELNU|nr:TPA_asm: hypothetical protein HUJ06_022363 [Nelumbo nucifera]